MVRLTVTGPDVRLPRIKGGLVVARTRGGWAIRGPTRPSRHKNNPAVLEQNERFRQAQLATKHMAPGQQKAAYELAQHSQLLPRDLQVQSLYGRGLTVYCTNGLRFYSVASRNDMSIVLDALGVEPGSMLYRGTDWWMAIPPGLPGYVLTAPDDLNDPPLWLPGGGGGAASDTRLASLRDRARRSGVALPRRCGKVAGSASPTCPVLPQLWRTCAFGHRSLGH